MATGTLSFWAQPDTTTQALMQVSTDDRVNLSSGVVTVAGFGTETVYIDGKQTNVFPDTNWHHITVVSGSNITANNIRLGRTCTVPCTYLAGKLDDVCIYNYGLTVQQIKTLYNEGSAVRFGPTEGLP